MQVDIETRRVVHQREWLRQPMPMGRVGGAVDAVLLGVPDALFRVVLSPKSAGRTVEHATLMTHKGATEVRQRSAASRDTRTGSEPMF